jgi:hypothetical protein
MVDRPQLSLVRPEQVIHCRNKRTEELLGIFFSSSVGSVWLRVRIRQWGIIMQEGEK